MLRSDLRIRPLASSSAGNAVVVDDGDSRILLDAGMRFRPLQVALEHQVASLAACFVTHEHQDHARAVPNLLRAGVPCFATAGTWKAIGVEHHRAKTVRAGEIVEADGWRVLPFAAVHDAAEPVGYLIARGSNRVLYLTDSAYSPVRFRGLTHVLLETNFSEERLRAAVEAGAVEEIRARRLRSSHLSIERALALLAANDLSNVRSIVLLHLSGGNADEDDFAKRIRRATGVPVEVAAA